MADTVKRSKVASGNKADLNSAITDGKVDEFDIVFTKDTKEIIFIDGDKEPQLIQDKTQEEVVLNGTNLGALGDGAAIPANTTFEEFLKLVSQKAIPATYTKPAISLTNNSGTSPGAYEAGTVITPKLKATFTKNDAGELTEISIKKGNESVETGATSPLDYIGEELILTDGAISFTASASYNEGEIKNNNLGEPSPNGHIEAGTINSATVTFTGQRNLFYGTGIGELPEITSDIIRGLTNKKLNPTNGYTWNIPVATGQQYVILAYPATLQDISQIMYVETNDTGCASLFTKTSIDVADAGGGENGLSLYKVYTYEMSVPAAANMTFKATI